MKHKFIFITISFFLIAFFIAYYAVYKNHRNIANEQASFILAADSFYEEFIENPTVSTKKYLDKTIQLSGVITEIDMGNFMIDDKVIFYADDSIVHTLEMGKFITVKGRSIGYDELLENPKIDQTTLITVQ
jgi:hypothetical protein